MQLSLIGMEARAMDMATRAHAGQLDKAGRPYIHHPLRVMGSFTDSTLRTIGVLHDVLEDTHLTVQHLRDAGMSERVIAGVIALTHRKGERLEAYWARVKVNPDAVLVKLADIADNSSPARLRVLPPADQARLTTKYRRARKALAS